MWSAFTGCKSAVMSRETEPSGRLWNTSTPQSHSQWWATVNYHTGV